MAEQFLWAGLALLLPLTSFPLVKKLTGADMVSPASGPLLLVLLLVSVLPLVWRERQVPRAALPLLAFACAALFSCALAFFLPLPPFRDQAILSNMLKALFTLAVGLGFYVAALVWASQAERAAFLLRWINWGGLAVIVWTLIQAADFRMNHVVSVWMEQAQALFTTSGLYNDRATGFAFEPSWLAHQLNMLYLPFWLAAALRGTSVHRLRLGFVTFERCLLAGGLLALWFTVSRIGFLSFVLCVILLVGIAMLRGLGSLRERLIGRARANRRLTRILVSAGLWMGVALAGVLLLLAAGLVLSKVDPRMKTLFNLSALKEFSVLRYANQLVFAERVVFWETGWNIFNDYPLFGVGLGNAGYFFSQKLSYFAWSLVEIRTLMYRWNTLPNIKSLWVRLLAETGIAGTGLFFSWLYVVWASAARLYRRPGLAGTVGLAGLFVLVGLLAEGFSVDTFALPYFWISFGLVTGLAASAGLRSR